MDSSGERFWTTHGSRPGCEYLEPRLAAETDSAVLQAFDGPALKGFPSTV